ncbi:long-chain fatty acid transport protein [Paraburkholderia sp. MM5496-R1]
MEKRRTSRLLAAGCALALASGATQAMNATQTNAAGVDESMMGGASIANPLTSAIAGDNPAGMAYLGNRSDLGGQVVVGHARSSFGSPSNQQGFGAIGPMPSGGVNVDVTERLAIGMSINSSGGGVNYPHAPLPIPGAPPAKAKDIYINFLPTVAYKITPDLALGVSAILGVQKFEAQGLVAPMPDGSIGVLPTHGMTTTYGIGGRIGAIWNVTRMLSVGAAYSTKVRFSRASGYADDLFAAAGGHLDEPSQYGAGLALHLSPRVTVAADVVRIRWSNVGVLGDTQTFGLHDQTALRFGASWDVTRRLTLRVGGKHSTASVDSNHTIANYYAPMILTDSLSGGLTWHASKKVDLSAGYEYDFPQTLKGTGPSTGTDIHARYSLIMFNLAMKF